MTEEEFSGTYYGKKVEQRRNPIDSDNYDGEISQSGNIKRYTNSDGIVEKTIVYNDDGSIKEYNTFEVSVAGISLTGNTIYKSVCTHYISDGNGGFKADTSSNLTGWTQYEQKLSSGNHYSTSDLQDAIDYNENNTTYTRNRH